MPKGGKINRDLSVLEQAVETYENAHAPQLGFFSTLDELILEAPFDKAPVSEWRNYLKPGRMLKRDGAQFPLKQEEIDYTTLPKLLDAMEAGGYPAYSSRDSIDGDFSRRVDPKALTRQDLLETLRYWRPPFDLEVSAVAGQQDLQKQLTGALSKYPRLKFNTPKYGPVRSPTLSHQTPGSEYQESVTTYPDLGLVDRSDVLQHFSPYTLSHSRTSSHELPEAGEYVRLVEEIQSDLHQDANDPPSNSRPDERRGYITADQRRRRAQLMREFDAIDDDPTGLLTDAEREEFYGIDRQISEAFDQRNARVISPEEYAAITQPLYAQQKEFYARGRSRSDWTDEKQQELDALEDLVGRRPVPDAPFKDSADYGGLELRKQLLNAVNNNEDYLALTTGQDQIERYGFQERDPDGFGEERDWSKQRKGLQYAYDTIYPSVLKKLANRYGAEITEIDLPVRAAQDIRPSIMREWQAETPSDFYHILMNEVEDSDHAGALFDAWTHQLQFSQELRSSLRKEYDAIRALDFRLGDLDLEPDSNPQQRDFIINEIRVMERPFLERLQHAYEVRSQDLMENRPDLYKPGSKKFPALKLTPEVREKIKRLGVPLWSIVGGQVVFDDEEQGGFAKGGRVIMSQKMRNDLWSRLESLRAQAVHTPHTERAEIEDQINETLDRIERMNETEVEVKPEFKAEGGPIRREEVISRWLADRAEQMKTSQRFGAGRPSAFVEDEVIDALGSEHQGKFSPPSTIRADNFEQIRRAFEESGRPMSEIELMKLFVTSPRLRQLRRRDEDYTEVLRQLRERIKSEPFQFNEKLEKAEGGKVSALDELKRFSDHLGHGLRTQWTGLDAKERPRGALYHDWEAPRDQWVWNQEAGDYLPPQRGVRPGIVDETLALPELGAMVAQSAGLDVEAPQFSKDAGERVGVLDYELRQQHGVDDPESWLDYIAEAGGVMLGQVPVPGSQGKRAAGVLGKAAQVPGALVEWFMPTITPTAKNYALGTAAGAVMMKKFPQWFGSEEFDPAILPEIHSAVESGELAPEDAELILSELAASFGTIEAPEEETFMTAGEFAKGGKVKPPDKLALRQRISQLMSEAAVPEHQQMVPVEPKPSELTMPTVEDPLPGGAQTPLLETPVSRRTFLEGAASLMAPVDLDPRALALKELEAVVEAAPVAAKAIIPSSAVAEKLSNAWSWLLEGSEDALDQLDWAKQELVDLPGSEEVQSLIDRAKEIETAYYEADGYNPNSPEEQAYIEEWERIRNDLATEFPKLARQHKLVTIRDQESVHGDPVGEPRFIEPPVDVADSLVSYAAEWDELALALEAWGDQAYRIATDFAVGEGSWDDIPELKDDYLISIGIDDPEGFKDSLLDYLQSSTSVNDLKNWGLDGDDE